MKLYTFDPKKGQTVFAGYIEGDFFYKIVTARHFMRIMKGYGIQEDIIVKLQAQGVKKILIETPTSLLESELSQWLEPHIQVRNFGNGKQRFLPVKHMKAKYIGRKPKSKKPKKGE